MNIRSQAIVPPVDNNKSSISGWPLMPSLCLAGLQASLRQPSMVGAAPADTGAMDGSRQPLSEVVNTPDQLWH